MQIQIDNLSIVQDEDIIFTTVGRYKLFMASGPSGLDAFLVWSHLMFTARLQKTNSVKASKSYLKNGLHMGQERLTKAKAFLVEHGIIEQITRRDKTGKITGHYIRLNACSTPAPRAAVAVEEKTKPTRDEKVASDVCQKTRGQTMAEPYDGCRVGNALTNKLNALTKKEIHVADATVAKEEANDDYAKQYFHAVERWFYDNNESYRKSHNGVQAKCIKVIQSKGSCDEIFRLLKKFLLIKQERRENQFWQEIPITPKGFLSVFDKLLAIDTQETPEEKVKRILNKARV